MSSTSPPAAGALEAPPTAARRRREVPQTLIMTSPLLFAIVALGAYTASQSSIFLTQPNLENILQQSAVLGLLAVGMTFLMGAGLMDLSVGALAALIAVIGAKMVGAGSASWLIVVAAIGVGVGAGALTGWIVAAARVAPFILTLGSMSVFASLALIVSNGQPIPLEGSQFSTLGLGKWGPLPAAGALFLVAALVGALLLRYARVARNGFAMGSSPQAAFLAGVPIMRVTIALFSLSGVLVGLAGVVLLGRLGAGDPTSGTGLELQAIAAVVLGGASLSGGRASMWGSVLGVILLTEIANCLNLLGVQAFYHQLVYGAFLMFAVITTALRESGRFKRLRLRRGA